VVVSVVSFGPDHQLSIRAGSARNPLRGGRLRHAGPAALAREALFVVDERDQFVATRAGGSFAGYRIPRRLWESAARRLARPDGRVSSLIWASARGRRLASAILKHAKSSPGLLLPR